MTYMKDTETGISGFSVVLRPNFDTIKSPPLTYWLSDVEPTPIWIPLASRAGVIKVMPILSNPKHYPTLMQSLCQQMSWNTAVEWQGKYYQLMGIEVDTKSLHLLQIVISATEQIPQGLERAIHAICFKWIAAADSVLAEQLHQQNTLPFTISIKPNYSRQQIFLQIGLFQKELLAPLLWGLSHDLGKKITLAGISCQLEKWVDFKLISSFEVLSKVLPQRVISLQFLSPTSFKQSKAIQPFPLPELVFSSLLRRWNAFAPLELQFPIIDWKGQVSAYNLKTQTLKLKGGTEIGTTGWVRYEFPEPEQKAIATVLAHFANFAGVGRKTAMGMGQVAFN